MRRAPFRSFGVSRCAVLATCRFYHAIRMLPLSRKDALACGRQALTVPLEICVGLRAFNGARGVSCDEKDCMLLAGAMLSECRAIELGSLKPTAG